MTRLERLLIRHEGIELMLYLDTTGHWTIGVGRNLTDNGIDEAECLYMMRRDLKKVRMELRLFLWFRQTSYVRQCVFMDMYYNLGYHKFLSFKKMIAAAERGDHEAVVKEMLDSRWARQVGDRATQLAEMYRTNKWPKIND